MQHKVPTPRIEITYELIHQWNIFSLKKQSGRIKIGYGNLWAELNVRYLMLIIYPKKNAHNIAADLHCPLC